MVVVVVVVVVAVVVVVSRPMAPTPCVLRSLSTQGGNYAVAKQP